MFSGLKIFEYFILGICVGSFLNVVIFRLPNQISVVKLRSFCPRCKKTILWKSNIPLISFLIQKGRCYFCRKKISLKYPIVEFMTGIFFIIFSFSSPYVHSLGQDFPFVNIFSWVFLSLLIAISFIDLDHFWIPQGLINFGFLLGILNLVSVWLINYDSFNNFIFLKFIFASLGAYLFFECLRITAKYFYKKDALGRGDSKLVSMMAFWLGPSGISLAIWMAYIIAAVFLLISFQFAKIKKAS